MQQLQNIGKYELNKFLGGGMSHVYKARDTLIGRTVAVKILTGSGAADQETRARFIREAQLAGNVIHENIIRVYDFGEEAGQLFMVMEFLEGEDLNDAIRQSHTGGIEQRIAIALQIASAMEHIHSLEIVHRDLKPQNVYITTARVAKLMDFGIAKTDQTSMTKTGYTVGTPSYMAPEQVLGKNVGRLSDIYSFGILLFELVSGTKPMAGDSIERVFWMILNQPVDLSPLQEAHAPGPLIELIRSCTEKDPAARPQSFTAVREQLEGLSQPGRMAAASASAAQAEAPKAAPGATPASASPVSQEAKAQPAAVPAPSNRKWIAAAGVAALILLGVLAALLWRAPKGTPSAAVAPAGVRPATLKPPPTLALPSGDMVLVSAGPFLFGENKESRETPAYYIDRAEVTNAAYGAFLKATGHAAPDGFSSARPDDPVTNVTIADARDFARWAGKRLPNSLEWEKAGRGGDARRYPWGDNENGGPPHGRLLTAAESAASASPYGVLQMDGNVWELVDQAMKPSAGALQFYATRITPKPTAQEPWCMMRGGSYLEKLIPVYEWSSIPERFHSKDIGFRCVRDVP